MVASNTTDKPTMLPAAGFSERIAGFTTARNVLNGNVLNSI